MPKPKDKHDEQHLKNVQLYLKRIQELYKLASDEASKIGCSINGVDSSKPFTFDDYPQTQKKMNALLSKFKKSLEVSIVNGIDAEWALSNSKNDEIVNKAFGSKKNKLTDEQKKRYFNNNEDAKDAFIERKRNGLSLSDSVWDFTKRFKSEIEMGLDLGIRSGKSADQMSRSLRDYLQNTNKLFRCYKDEHGILQLSKAAKAFHPGQGVYRSSYMNARRLAATETNIAYRTADHLRWKEMDFVVGIEIHLSNNHTCKGRDGKPHDFHDICDELQGKYPKDFKFTGWHPHCRCFATTILKTPEELKSRKPSKNEVKELPSKFKEWYENNKERIDKAKSLPYFIKDNFKDGEFIGQKPLTTLEKAKIRQDARTKEQIADIQKRWDERKKNQLIRVAASNVLNVAKDYSEVDYSKLEAVIGSGDIKKISTLTREVAKAVSDMKKQEKALSTIIPNVHEWHKKFTIDELKNVYSAVEKKLANWDGLTLSEQAKKLKFEADEYFGTNEYGAQTKYKTWGVAQDAYKMHLYKVQYKIDKQTIEASVSHSFSFAQKTKSAKVKQLVSELQSLLGNKATIAELQSKADALNNEVSKLEAAKLARDLKKLSKLGNGFSPDAYTQERKDKAVWDKGNGKVADETLIDVAAKSWIASTEDEKDRVYEYTSHYCNVNEPLQGRKYLNHQTKADFEHRVNNITSYISKNILPKDMWFMRGDDGLGVIASRIRFAGGKMPNDLQDLVGMTMQEGGFMSTGSRKGKGFSNKSVIINVYAPKGTQAAYIEPISEFGNGAGRKWDGKQRFSSFSYEHETLFQRGTLMRITKVYQVGTQTFIDCEVIGQEIKPLSYVPDSNIGY